MSTETQYTGTAGEIDRDIPPYATFVGWANETNIEAVSKYNNCEHHYYHWENKESTKVSNKCIKAINIFGYLS